MTKIHRLTSLLLCCVFLLTCFSDTVVIADDVNDGTCNHKHTEGCYTQLIQCVFDAAADAGDRSGNDSSEGKTDSEDNTGHICSEESGCITKILQCTHTHDEYCGYYGTRSEISVISWEWVDEEEILVYDESTDAWWLGLPGAGEEYSVTAEVLTELLPREIEATLSDGARKKLTIAWDLSVFAHGGLAVGQLIISAALSEEYTLGDSAPKLEVILDLGGAETFLTKDQLAPHILTKDNSRVVDNPPNTMVNLFNYGVTGDVSPATGAIDKLPNPEVTHYRTKDNNFTGAWGLSETTKLLEFGDYNKGINENHLLIFGDVKHAHTGLWNRGSGATNGFGMLFAGTEGMVNSVLPSDGYPTINTEKAFWRLDCDPDDPLYNNYTGLNYDRNVQLPGKFQFDNPYTIKYNDPNKGWYYKWELMGDWKSYGDDPKIHTGPYSAVSDDVQNISKSLIKNWETVNNKTFGQDTESLGYLFNPDAAHDLKKSYSDVKGLFQLGDDGYYYYNMRENFAEYNPESNRFILYDAPATNNTLEGKGNFFPFNSGERVFTGIQNGKLISNGVNPDSGGIDHYFGLTMETGFRQPIGGKVSNDKNESKDMTFEFSGDDDVWVFVDDVLVLDLGGIHSEIYGTINFSTGEVYTGRSYYIDVQGSTVTPRYKKDIMSNPANPDQMVSSYNLRELFRAAGKEDSVQWTGNTFASHTDHTIKLFYLERGNYDSSLSMRFNLVPRLFQQIKKVDQDGSPLAGVGFDLYAAEEVTDSATGKVTYKATGNALTSLVTGADGIAHFTEPQSAAGGDDEQPFNFSDRYAAGQKYYILRETVTPSGYRKLPTDIILEFDNANSMLTVKNRYQSGSYSSFVSTVIGNRNISYGSFDPATGGITPTEHLVTDIDQRDGLVVAIPMLFEKETQKWEALYGSNVTGFKAIVPESRTPEEWRKACLTAMLYQCSDTNENVPDWYLKWNNETKRLEGTLSDLPGMASRYLLNNSEGDMKMAYAIIKKEALTALGINESDDGKVYEAIGAKINSLVGGEKNLDDAVAEVCDIILHGNGIDRWLHSLNTDQFNRSFRSLIYIPNERRELRVWKVDQNGIPVNGVEFSLYNNSGCTGDPVAAGITATVDRRDGVLVFTPSPKMDGNKIADGYSNMIWANSENAVYYLKETKAPDDYKLNETVVHVHVGIYSIYADAGVGNNGVTVMTEVGKLAQTMKKYAADEEVNITLRDITATAQTQPSGQFNLNGWEEMKLEGTDTVRSLNLHYGKNALIDYGIHDEDGGQHLYPYFVTDEGFITVRVKQNGDAITGAASYGDVRNSANYDLLGDMDITSLFSLVNIVVVTDTNTKAPDHGELTVSKRIEGPAELIKNDYNRTFEFRLELTDENGAPIPAENTYYFYGTDKSGYIQNGDTFYLHHDETFTILGLPVGTHYTITETGDSEGNYIAAGGAVRQGVIQIPDSSETGTAEQRADFVNVRNSIMFEFTKVDAFENEKVLPGAGFSLYHWIGEGSADEAPLIPADGAADAALWTLIASTESDENGLVRFGKYLTTGTYRLVETKAPTGYLRPRSQWQFNVIVGESAMEIDNSSFKYVGDRNDKPPAFIIGDSSVQDGVTVCKYLLPNMAAVDLPFTGGGTKTMFMLFGAGLILTASAFAIWCSSKDARKRYRVKKC